MNIQAELDEKIAYLKLLEATPVVGTEPGQREREIAEARHDVAELEALARVASIPDLEH